MKARDRLFSWEGEALIVEILPLHYWVSFRGSYWAARCPYNLRFTVGELVFVVGRERTTLLIQKRSP